MKVSSNQAWLPFAPAAGTLPSNSQVSIGRFSSNLLEAKRAKHHKMSESRNDMKKSPDNNISLASGLACIVGSARVI
jgi:hypothetical protein